MSLVLGMRSSISSSDLRDDEAGDISSLDLEDEFGLRDDEFSLGP